MPPSRLAEKLKKLVCTHFGLSSPLIPCTLRVLTGGLSVYVCVQGLSQEDSAGSASCSPAAAKKKLLHFRVFFPLPPFEGIHFNALKAGKNLYNFTVRTCPPKQGPCSMALCWCADKCVFCRDAALLNSSAQVHRQSGAMRVRQVPMSLTVASHHAAMLLQGLLLGVGGKQLQKIKQESNARVEVVNAQGNLNGTHPDPLDADLHALITADSLVRLIFPSQFSPCW